MHYVFTVFFVVIRPVFGDEQNMTEKQKLSYALVVFFAQSESQQDIDMDVEHFMAAVADILNKNQPKLVLNSVIAGWQQALPLMKTGANWQLYIPKEFAYGPLGQGAIGSDETLIFEVELIAVHLRLCNGCISYGSSNPLD